jgi:hypothetical protein
LLQQRESLLAHQNEVKEQQLEELLEKVTDMRSDMAQEIEAFTKSSLVLEV